MKRLFPILAAAMLAACGSKSSGTSSSGSTGTTTTGSSTTTGGSTSSTTSSSTTTTGGSTGLSSSGSTGSSGTTGGSSGSTGGSSGSTGGPPPANDLCANAIALTPQNPSDTQTVSGDTTNATSDFSSVGCLGHGGDVFYSLHLAQNAEVTVTMTPADSTKTAVVSILPDCSATTELSCGDSSSTGTASVTSPHLAAGDYIIVADNYTGDEGPFSLTVTLAAPVAGPSNDTCSAPKTLTEGTPLTNETFFGASNDYSPDPSAANCTGYSESGPDLVYSFTPSQTGKYDIVMTDTTDGGSNPYLALYVLDTCPASATVSQCLAGFDNSGTLSVRANLTANTQYFVIADSESASASTVTFSLSASALPFLPGDTCEALETDGGTDLALADPGDGGLFAQVAYDTTNYGNDTSSAYGGSCNGVGLGGERVYHVALGSAAASLTASITPPVAPDGGVQMQPVISIRSSPCSDAAFADGGAGAEIACNAMSDGGMATTSVTSPAAGDYYIWVDEFGGTEGPATLTVTVP